MVDPIDVACATCNSWPGERCHLAGTRRNTSVTWFHASREEAAAGTVETYYKAVRPDGTDFYTGKVDYLAGGVLEHPYPVHGSDDARHYFSVSTSVTDCTGFSWPARLLEIEPVGEVRSPDVARLPNKRAVTALRVVRELDAKLLLGPQADHLIALVERAKALTPSEARDLNAATGVATAVDREAARSVATGVATSIATGAARGAARGAAQGAAWDTARGGARIGARDAAWGLVVRDLIGTDGWTLEYYDRLTGPWRRTIGPIHPDDSEIGERP